jgi:hypothetical protein
MSDWVKCLWYFFFATLYFGLWTIPIILFVWVLIYLYYHYKGK